LPIIFILAGGFGTRLSDTVPDVPKSLAPINNKPFLDYQIQEIRKVYGDSPIYLLTHYMSHLIEKQYKNFKNIFILKEDEPLGTGGAIKNAIKKLDLTEKDEFILMNGDTYMKVDFYDFVKNSISDTNILCTYQKDCERSSTINIDNKVIKKFNKQGLIKSDSYISAGCYYFKNKSFFNPISKKIFMIEDELEKYCKTNDLGAYIYDGIFIDIGIPQDYYKMCDYINMGKFKSKS